MGKALDGVRILDFTHVQSGPPARSFSRGLAPT
jgi:crotonobetainyl-CoA:carnitine CoA-transferase CaiB-like acyl-CoA transferase